MGHGRKCCSCPGAAQGVADKIVDANEAETLPKDDTRPWERYFLAYDPAPTLARLTVPVLVLKRIIRRAGVLPWLEQRDGLRQDLIETGAEFQVARHGEDPRFEGSPARVAANILRDRASNVLQPAELATRHHAYRCRVMIGPTYRADMWAALEEDPTLSVAALARRTYGSFSTAWARSA
jgi:hypothetical protein